MSFFASPWVPTTVIMIFVIQFFFGCGFACLPNILDQNYGMKQIATIQGLMLSAWGIAGLVGNQFSLFIMSNYTLNVLYMCLAIIFTIQLALLLIWVKIVFKKGDSL